VLENFSKKRTILSWPFILRASLVLLIFGLLASFLIHNATAINQDLGRHLKLGQIIWQTKHIPNTNLFSYTEPNFPFINHHWLSEVIFYGIYTAGGFKGLILFTALMGLLSFGLVFALAWRRKYFLLTIWAAVLSVGLLIERTDIRPEIFGWLGLALFLVILDRNKEKIKLSIWWLLPVQLLWVNLHISFVYGLALIFIFFLDRLWARRQTIHLLARKKKIDSYIATTIFIGALLGLISFINPNTWRGALYPLSVFKNYGYAITENQSPFFLAKLAASPTIIFFKAALVILALGFIVNWRRFNFFYFLISLLVTVMSCSAIRNFPLMGLIILPVLVSNFSQARESWSKYFVWWTKNRLRPWLRLLTILAIFAILIGSIYCIVSNRFYLKWGKADRFGLSVPMGAAKAVDFLQEQKISGRMFNNFDIGSYLIWRLYPQQQVFVDNRREAYSDDFWQSVYIPMQNDAATWQRLADDVYRFDYVFFVHTDATPWGQNFLKNIWQNKNWRLIYLDPTATIWVRNTASNKGLIEKFGLDKESLAKKNIEYLLGNNINSDSINDWVCLGSFFKNLGFNDLALPLYERAFSLYSQDKNLAFTLGTLNLNQGKTGQALNYFKKATELDANYEQAHLVLGEVYYQQGDFSEARRAWEKVLSIDPGDQQAKLYLDNMGLIPFKK